MPPKINKQSKRTSHARNAKKSESNNGINYTEALVTSTVNTAIGHLLEAINLIDQSNPRFVIYNCEDQLKSRTKIYDAIGVLRALAPNNGDQTHINKLPDDCLVSIFEKKFSMQTQIGKLRSVCRRWKFAIESQVCAPKRSLKLFVCEDSLRKYGKKLIKLNLHRVDKFKLREIGCHDHDLVLSRSWYMDVPLPQELFYFLGSLFPNLEHLVVGVQEVSDSNQQYLAHLVLQWPNLKHLSLFIKLSRNESNLTGPVLSVLYRTINPLASLKSLDLLGEAFQSGIAIELLNVLPQLEHLALENYESHDCGPFLAKLNVTNLVSLRLDNFENVVANLQSSCLSMQLNTKMLRLSNVAKNLENIKSICSMFPHLTKLELNFDDYIGTLPLNAALITTLNGLTQLRELSLANIRIEMKSFQKCSEHHLLPKSAVTSLHLANLFVYPLGGNNGSLLTRVLAAMFPSLEQFEYLFGILDANCFGQSFVLGKCKLHPKNFQSKIASLRKCDIYYWHCANEYLGRHQQDCECYDQYFEHHFKYERIED